MEIESELKPLYANLKRLEIGRYLATRDFELFVIESDLDEIWHDALDEVERRKPIAIAGQYTTDDYELAFIYLLSAWYNQLFGSFHKAVLAILINFANWSSIRIDYTSINKNLREIGIPK